MFNREFFLRFVLLVCATITVASGVANAQSGGTYDHITIDGNLSDWLPTDRLDIAPNAGQSGDAAYGDFAQNNFLIALQSPAITPGTTVTVWINSDRNLNTGFNYPGYAAGVSGGADFNARLTVGGTADLYTGAAGQTLVSSGLDFASSTQNHSLELAIPKSLLNTNGTGIQIAVDIGNTRFLPIFFSLPQYLQPEFHRPVRTNFAKRALIVYSSTTVAKFFDSKAYSQLFMTAQHESMMAGIPYDVVDETALQDVSTLLNYDVIVFPFMNCVPAASRENFQNTLYEASFRYNIGLVAAGDFFSNDETGAAFAVGPYLATQNLFGVAPATVGTATYTINVTNNTHPVTKQYAPNQTILSYTNSGFHGFSLLGTYPGTTLATNSNDSSAAILATQTGGRNVFFTSFSALGDSKVLWSALRWIVYGDAPQVALQMGRQKNIFFSRNDMDQSQYSAQFATVNTPLKTLLDSWQATYNFIGSYYVNIGNNPAPNTIDWTQSTPYLQCLMSVGNEVGNHSYTHPADTNVLTDAQLDFEFNQSRSIIQTHLGTHVYGTAVPGNPDGLVTANKILAYTDYLSGGNSGGLAGGYLGAYGYLTPTSNKLYFSPSIASDYTLIEFKHLTPAQAEAQWQQEYLDSTLYGSQPIVHWPWHDYGPTTGLTQATNQYSLGMYQHLIQTAANDDSEFVNGIDLSNRIVALNNANVTVQSGSPLTVTVDGSNLGTFSLLLSNLLTGANKISSVANWYAYSTDRVFVPQAGGTFVIALGSAPDDVTHISKLPMRAKLISVSGNGKNLSFVIDGAGDVEVTLNSDATAKYNLTGADSYSRNGNIEVMHFNSATTHTVGVTTEYCGDGIVNGLGESCDDSNTNSGDGCSNTCRIETGYSCSGTPSSCHAVCGDGIVTGGETCDDGNTTPGDGCSATCTIETGMTCAGSPSVCAPKCGDGIISGNEQCDDGNQTPGDGCSASCTVESGFTCGGLPSTCHQSVFVKELTSIDAQDGWIKADSLNATNAVVNSSVTNSLGLMVGDDQRNQTYRSIVSFDTSSIPANAVITSAVLTLRRGGTTGSNPFDSLGTLVVAIKNGFFGQSEVLEADDFAAAATDDQAAIITESGGAQSLYRTPISANALAAINRSGLTQFRLGFATATDMNSANNLTSFFPGSAAQGRDRAKLVITYGVP